MGSAGPRGVRLLPGTHVHTYDNSSVCAKQLLHVNFCDDIILCFYQNGNSCGIFGIRLVVYYRFFYKSDSNKIQIIILTSCFPFTGYIGADSFLHKVCDIITELKDSNQHLTYGRYCMDVVYHIDTTNIFTNSR